MLRAKQKSMNVKDVGMNKQQLKKLRKEEKLKQVSQLQEQAK